MIEYRRLFGFVAVTVAVVVLVGASAGRVLMTPRAVAIRPARADRSLLVTTQISKSQASARSTPGQ
jgi:hypothetical protein